MPPRTRSGRSERLENERLMLAGPVNTHGFPSLPVELLLEVVSHLVRVPIPSHKQSVYHARYLAHHDTLRSLSQTCQCLRSIFLPLVWRRIEVCASKLITSKTKKGRKFSEVLAKDIATELVRQLEIVTIRDPTLAQYVQVVSVIMQDYSYDTVLVELARCLAHFPNLLTLQILGINRHMMETTQKVFEGLTFPQIRTLVVPATGHYILAACPNVKNATCVGGYYQTFCNTLFQHCPNVVSLGGFGAADCATFLTVVAKKLPNLEELAFDIQNEPLTPEALSNLSAFKRLDTVCFDFTSIQPKSRQISRSTKLPGLERERKAVMAAFKNIPQQDGVQKRVILKYEHKSRVFKFDASLS